jgi:putative ubiquitin-RnfH superfamily antitoxin RatB of RatAB toxin-antitoxin module
MAPADAADAADAADPSDPAGRADPTAAGAVLAVEVVYCPAPGVVDSVSLRLQAGATVADALHASGVLVRHGLAADGLRVGVWCKACDLATPLRNQDRVEVYRLLTVDPKEARRLRYKRARGAAAAA